MPHAVVSDIHGNLQALERVLEDLGQRGVESIACLGDFVGYGADPNACMDRLLPRIDVAVAGNHDYAAIGRVDLAYFNPDAARSALWTQRELTPVNRAYLEHLPMTAHWRGILLVHSSPIEPEAWYYVLSTEEAAEHMRAYHEDVCLIGHSHVPGNFERNGDGAVRYDRDAVVQWAPDRKLLINVPSVGQPRDGDPRTGYLLIDEDAKTLTHVRLEYDVAEAKRRIEAAGLPRSLGERLQWGE
jgi:predicted phosphodiesterase